MHRCHRVTLFLRLLHHEGRHPREQLVARDILLLVNLKDVATVELLAERAREKTVAVSLDRGFVRGDGGHSLHDGRSAPSLEHELARHIARVKEDAARVTAVEVDDDVLDADTSELVLQLGEFDSGRVAPVSVAGVGESA